MSSASFHFLSVARFTLLDRVKVFLECYGKCLKRRSLLRAGVEVVRQWVAIKWGTEGPFSGRLIIIFSRVIFWGIAPLVSRNITLLNLMGNDGIGSAPDRLGGTVMPRQGRMDDIGAPEQWKENREDGYDLG